MTVSCRKLNPTNSMMWYNITITSVTSLKVNIMMIQRHWRKGTDSLPWWSPSQVLATIDAHTHIFWSDSAENNIYNIFYTLHHKKYLRHKSCFNEWCFAVSNSIYNLCMTQCHDYVLCVIHTCYCYKNFSYVVLAMWSILEIFSIYFQVND